MFKFKVSPSVRAAAIPTGTGFGAFNGLMRHCQVFKAVKGADGRSVLRCSEFKEGRGRPECDSRLKDGGRSPGLVRKAKCPGPKKSAAKKVAKKTPAKRKPAKKK